MYTDMYNMLRNMEPPVGFGKKCPYRLAYRVWAQFTVSFTVTTRQLDVTHFVSGTQLAARIVGGLTKNVHNVVDAFTPLALKLIITDRVSMGSNAVASVRLSVRPFPLYLSSRLTFGIDLSHVCGSLPWHKGDWNWRSQVKVKTRSVWPRSSIEDSFLVLYMFRD